MSSKKTILDVFTQISSEKDAAKPDLCLSLWNHLNSLDHTNIEIVIYTVLFLLCITIPFLEYN
ncbi:hypothetical protein PGB90_004317 [Kerria lacca]